MKAEDTVMSAQKIADLQAKYSEPEDRSIGYEWNIAQAQAKITWPLAFEEGKKAGYEERDKDIVTLPLADLLEKSYRQGVKDHCECCDIDYKAGIKEVVEFVLGGNCLTRTKLEDWGIES